MDNKNIQLTAKQQRDMILNIASDFLEEGDLEAYLEHIGLDLTKKSGDQNLGLTLLSHYCVKAGEYDVDKACEDLRRWPPIAARIAELMAEKERKAR